MSAQITCEFILVKEGQDIHQYKQTSKPAVLQRLYLNGVVSYFVFGDKPPKRLRVTVEAMPEET